jgi:hypothetical protein
MKKTAVSHKPGDIIEFAGSKFVVLDILDPYREVPEGHGYTDNGPDLFILSLESQGESRFGDNNNYAESELRRRTAAWLDDLLAHGVDPDLIRTRTLDLTTMDGHGKYGKLTVKAAPLTMDEARKYADIILNCDDACWLATGWGGPEFYGATYALYVSTSGFWSGSYCSVSYGIRPALVISSLLLTSKEEPDLSEASTEELLGELRRRIEE